MGNVSNETLYIASSMLKNNYMPIFKYFQEKALCTVCDLVFDLSKSPKDNG